MKEKVEVRLHSFLISALNWSVQHHALAALPPEINPGTHCIGGWVGSRARLHVRRTNYVFFLQGLEPRTLHPMSSF